MRDKINEMLDSLPNDDGEVSVGEHYSNNEIVKDMEKLMMNRYLLTM